MTRFGLLNQIAFYLMLSWVHIDIAGVAQTKSESEHAPAGATGWGVMTLDTLVKNNFEEP